jgi:hypothetical protein
MPTTQRGRPKPAAKAAPRAITIGWPRTSGMTPTVRPMTPLTIQNIWTFSPRPAWRRRAAMVSDAFFCWRSCSFSVLRICLRRASGVLATALARAASRGAAPTMIWARLAARAALGSPPARAKPRAVMVTKPRIAIRKNMTGYSAASRASASSRSRP